ncbi:LacI family DNA-binding transcriptional regulator [Isoptericola cucumis]|uniref:LacI family transcriptional regulator n=1 Tax=Isoptericola cucumis TaxID=1776856 RepID=A0ABQ2B7S4_9MICO|nr:LacI family DNA-binding transcriptional regulator [Isoptericola cucumis]GGI09673.1 LacI family transcriptional regulator [Isoptericola cucumis]
MDDLASALGLSPNTVSRALRGRDGVSERTRQLVLNEAVRVGYVLPPAASVHAGVETIAITVPSVTHPFASQLLAAIETGVRAAGYALDLYATEESTEQEEAIAEQILRARPAGVIAIPVQGAGHCWERVHAAGIPVVATSREIADTPADFVGVDSEAGTYAAARHLIGAGARRLLYVEEDLAITTIERRRAGVERALAMASDLSAETLLIPTRRFEGTGPQWRAQEGYRVVAEQLSASRPFDALVTGDDFFALGALRALHERGRAVPSDVKVVGYGDLSFADWTTPSLTSVRLPTRLVGELAVAALLQRVAGGSGEPLRRLIRPELIVRDSSSGAGDVGLSR